MADRYLIFVHGKGPNSGGNSRWQDGLWRGIGMAGWDRYLASDQIEEISLAPTYTDDLYDSDIPSELPQPLRTSLDSKADAESHAEFLAGNERMRALVGSGYPSDLPARALGWVGKLRVGTTSIADAVLRFPKFADVRSYSNEQNRRWQIIKNIVASLPIQGECVLIAHSLGSVVAFDLLRYWPADLKIRTFVTIGSPLSIGEIRNNLEGRHDFFPYDRLGSWLNVFDPNDVVTAGAGLEEAFDSKCLDHQVENGGYRSNHDVDRYLAHVTVGLALGSELQQLLEVDLPEPKTPGMDDLGLRFVWLEQAARLLISERIVHHMERALGEKARTDRRFARANFARLHGQSAVNRTLDVPPLTRVSERVDKLRTDAPHEGVIGLLMTLVAEPPFAPFDIEIDDAFLHQAQDDVAEELGFGRAQAGVFRNAFERALAAQDKTFMERLPGYAAGGSAVLLLGLATGGVGLMAAPGLAGAAALSSGLAAMGSLVGGGMAAGVFVATGAGVASLSAGAAAVGMLTPAEVQLEIVKMHARALVHLDAGRIEPARDLVDRLRDLLDGLGDQQRHHAHIDDDKDGPKAKAWATKLDAVRRAVRALRDAAGLQPDDRDEDAPGSDNIDEAGP